MNKIPVAILGATGMVGQQMLLMLKDHPYFKVSYLCASENSFNKEYQEAARWMQESPLPEEFAHIKCRRCTPDIDCRIVFSALDSSVAGPLEDEFADNGYIIVSNSKNHRMEPDVPLMIPEINPEHLILIQQQKKRRKKGGFIITNPNCSTIFMAMALHALMPLNPQRVIATTMQALSGAGYPGVPSMAILGNIVPHIQDEAEKIESENLKILSSVKDNTLIPPAMILSAQVNRVPVLFGHTAALNIAFENPVTVESVIKLFESYTGEPQKLGLPSAPKQAIIVRTEPDRPQPKFDAMAGKGMSVTAGKIALCPATDGIKFTVLGHNTIRGAAGAAVLNAELLLKKYPEECK